MPFRCPNCQGLVAEPQSTEICPYCGTNFNRQLTPLETGVLTDFGMVLMGGATGLLLSIAAVTYIPALRSPFTVVVFLLGGTLMAWGHAKNNAAGERLGWEQGWIVAFCGSVGAFYSVLLGLSWHGMVATFGIGLVLGYLLCRQATIQWRKGRRK